MGDGYGGQRIRRGGPEKRHKESPQRSRLYQGIIDSKLLPPGEMDFNKMPNVFVIVIMSFDLFKKGRYRYTFHVECEEFPELRLSDGATRIFLNTKGTDATGVSKELIELLNYMDATNDETSEQCESERIKSMQAHIATIKSSEEIGVKYMQEWEEKAMERQEALEEGRREGHSEGFLEGERSKLMKMVQKKLQKGKSLSLIAEELEEEVGTIQEIIEHLENIPE